MAAAHRAHYGGLDVLRGFAAIAVVLLHWDEDSLRTGKIMPSAWLAVDLFFVLSGFVIAHAYDDRLLKRKFGPLRFLMIRIIRFYPLYVAGLILGILRATLLIWKGDGQFGFFWIIALSVLALFFIPASSATASPLNAPGWSLEIEIWINFIYALTIKMAWGWSVAIVVISGLRIASTSPLYQLSHNFLAFGLCRGLFSFFLGAIIYRYGRGESMTPAYAAILVVFAVMLVFMAPRNDLVSIATILIVNPIVVIVLSSYQPNKVFSDFMGLFSYYIYAIHWPFISIASAVSKRLHVNSPVFVFVSLVVLCSLCGISDVYLDRPLRRWMQRVFLQKN